MSVRLSLLALATLVLGACDGAPLAPARQAACCCGQCPTDAAPAAKGPPATAETGRTVLAAGGGERVTAARVRTAPRVRREVRSYRRYESSGEAPYGGRYGARGGVYGGVGVSVRESETSSERYSYRESSSAYGSSSASGAYGYGYGGPPGHRGYRLAGADEHGYLTWPGKVED